MNGKVGLRLFVNNLTKKLRKDLRRELENKKKTKEFYVSIRQWNKT